MSKGGRMESDMDPSSVVVLKKSGGGGGYTLKTAAAINSAKARGLDVETNRKQAGGTNAHKGDPRSMAKLDNETEELKHDRLGMDVGRLIAQCRQAKELTQKDLAGKICEKPQVINEYESGKAVPNQQILGKLERALGVRLRGAQKGQPLAPKPKKK